MNNQELESQEKVALLRDLLERQGVDGFIVPKSDEYQGEEVPACAERLQWLTGFTGSYGTAVVLKDKAVVFSDGRYDIQLPKEVDTDLFETGDVNKRKLSDWIGDNDPSGSVIGYDPKLYTPSQLKGLRGALEPKGVTLKALDENPVDALWQDRPHPPEESVWLMPQEFAGQSFDEKLAKIAGEIKKQGASSCVLTMSDSVAWLLNIRGGDLKYTPVPLTFALVHADPARVDWFIEPERVPADVHKALGGAVNIVGPRALEHELSSMAAEANKKGLPVLFDPKRSSEWFRNKLEEKGAVIKEGDDPCVDLRAIKNEAEQNAMINAHRRDGLALVLFMAWLDAQDCDREDLTETGVAEKLESFRKRDPLYVGPSFNTIAAFGANGAITHHAPNKDKDTRLKTGNVLLLDSGGQYKDGTTDVTRVIALGEPSEEMRKYYTLVLKGHIAVDSAVFPEGTPSAQIDAFARKPLWDVYGDYAHGTGHGVGCCLRVHEESAHLSPKIHKGLRAGMILSNEPGYYREGDFGIRIENLILVEKTGRKSSIGDEMLRFRTLTLAPLDKRLIVPEMLDEREKEWVDKYHEKVRGELNTGLDRATSAWLENATGPV